jgi:bacterioferritin
MDREKLVELLNDDLRSEFQSIIQYVVHTCAITGAEYLSAIDELKIHLGQELQHAQILAEQVSFLGGIPESTASEVPPWTDSEAALRADLELEMNQLDRYRERFSPSQ